MLAPIILTMISTIKIMPKDNSEMNIKISKIHNSVKKILYNKLYILQIFVIYFQYITL